MSGRKVTPRGQMTRGTNSGPAVMMMPPHIRATFMPNPPLKSIPPLRNRRKHPITGVSDYLKAFETTEPPERILQPTPASIKEARTKRRQESHQEKLKPLIEEYRLEQRDCGGEYRGMNCYNTLFVGRLAYEVTERKLLREMETFGPVKYIKLIVDTFDTDNDGRSRGYAFVEYENEEDMKRAYRAADGMKIEGREVVVDVERGHTVPTWLPRRLGGGLGGTRLGGKEKNVTAPGRFDPSRPELSNRPVPVGMDGGGGGVGGPPPPGGMGRGMGPPVPFGGGNFDHRGGGYGMGGFRDGPPSGPYGGGGGGGPPPPLPPGGPYGPNNGGGRYGGPPPPPRGGGRDWGGSDGSGRKRHHERSPSPGRRYGSRPRY